MIARSWTPTRGPNPFAVLLMVAYLALVLLGCAAGLPTGTVDLETQRGRYGLIVEPKTENLTPPAETGDTPITPPDLDLWGERP